MSNPNPDTSNLVKFKPGQSGNPKGMAKGTKHISTWIQQMLEDEEFETTILDSKKGAIEYKGAPLKAIIGVAIHKAIHDSQKGNLWAEWLAKHGYGQKLDLNVNSNTQINYIEKILVDSGLRAEVERIKEGKDDRQDTGPVSGSPQEQT